jgi:hypothetical protein
MEILPGFANPIAELARGKSHHLPRELVGRVTLSSPMAVGSISLLQTAPFVFLAAAAGARVIPADLLVGMKGHDRVTLPRDIREGKQQENLRQKRTFIPGGRAFRHWGCFDRESYS